MVKFLFNEKKLGKVLVLGAKGVFTGMRGDLGEDIVIGLRVCRVRLSTETKLKGISGRIRAAVGREVGRTRKNGRGGEREKAKSCI